MLLAQPNNFKQRASWTIWFWQQASRNHTDKFGRTCDKVLFSEWNWYFTNNGELPQNFADRSLLPSSWWNWAWFSAHMGTKCNQSIGQWNNHLHCSFPFHAMRIEWTDDESNSFGTSVQVCNHLLWCINSRCQNLHSNRRHSLSNSSNWSFVFFIGRSLTSRWNSLQASASDRWHLAQHENWGNCFTCCTLRWMQHVFGQISQEACSHYRGVNEFIGAHRSCQICIGMVKWLEPFPKRCFGKKWNLHFVRKKTWNSTIQITNKWCRTCAQWKNHKTLPGEMHKRQGFIQKVLWRNTNQNWICREWTKWHDFQCASEQVTGEWRIDQPKCMEHHFSD